MDLFRKFVVSCVEPGVWRDFSDEYLIPEACRDLQNGDQQSKDGVFCISQLNTGSPL